MKINYGIITPKWEVGAVTVFVYPDRVERKDWSKPDPEAAYPAFFADMVKEHRDNGAIMVVTSHKGIVFNDGLPSEVGE